MFKRKKQVTVRRVSAEELRQSLGGAKMSEGEAAARLYLGRKQAEKEARIEAVFLAIWAFLVLGAVTAPAWLF